MAKKGSQTAYSGQVYVLRIGSVQIALPDGKGLETLLNALRRGMVLDCDYRADPNEYYRETGYGARLEVELIDSDLIHPFPKSQDGIVRTTVIDPTSPRIAPQRGLPAPPSVAIVRTR